MVNNFIMVIEVLMIFAAVAVLGFILYQAGVMITKPKRRKTTSGQGRTVVVDRSKDSDDLDDRFKDALKDKDFK